MWNAIFWGWLIAGTLDIADALIWFGYRGVAPIRLLQNIASGLVGQRAFQGGIPMALLGLALHFSIAFGATVTYNVAARWMPIMTQHPLWCGPIFGMLVFAFMNLVVLPLAFGHFSSHTTPDWLNLLFAHIFCIGLPIALTARKFSQSL